MELVDGNQFDKYRSANPFHRYLMRNFLDSIQDLYDTASPNTVLEVGCGPGDLAGSLRSRVSNWGQYMGTDLSSRQVAVARKRYADLEFGEANIYELPFEDASFDLVLACEVLEHLEQPERAMEEISRVAKRWILVSVPWEPYWRILNCMRGKYIGHLGNTPGHLSHFGRRDIRRLLETAGSVSKQVAPFPWTALLVDTNG